MVLICIYEYIIGAIFETLTQCLTFSLCVYVTTLQMSSQKDKHKHTIDLLEYIINILNKTVRYTDTYCLLPES